jgi:uncharacterized protein YlaI
MSRAAIRKRNASGKQTCDICGDVEFLEEHHIRGRKIKDANLPFNLANICPNCHLKVHLGELVIEDWVKTTSGRTLLCHKKDEESVTGNDAIPHIIGKKT